jgi:hypothetical protein
MKCGIAEYNLSLYDALKQLGHTVTIFANRRDTVRPDRKPYIAETILDERAEVVPCFNAGAWSESLDFDYPFLFAELEKRQIELIIVQYQNGIFHPPNLRPLFEHCKEKNIQVIVSFHDSFFGPFPFDLVEHYVCTHSRMKQILNSHYIPHGIPAPINDPKDVLKQRFGYDGTVVTTFGLGRTDYRLISEVAGELHYRFAVIDSADSCRIGGEHVIHIRNWLSKEQLLMRLGASDVIVLWYPEIDAYVSSSAISLALASLRPVIVNDVNWFRDIPDDVAIKVKDEKELREKLSGIAQHPINQKQIEYVNQNQWQNIAQRYLEVLRG